MTFLIRPAGPADVAPLNGLVRASVLGLQSAHYTARQLELALATVYGVDSQLVADGTYYAVEAATGGDPVLVGCGGWSRRRTLYGGDVWRGREDALLDPARDAAKIRAFFVHPGWARRGIGTLILDTCEKAAATAGFARLEMGATLSGIAFYRTRGYTVGESIDVPLAEGEVLPIVHMFKQM